MGWRVVVDEVLCQGHAVCESEAPDVFEVPKHGKVVVLDATPPDSLRAAVQQAVTYCPTHAIKIEED
jgi:ferredoxin